MISSEKTRNYTRERYKRPRVVLGVMVCGVKHLQRAGVMWLARNHYTSNI